MKRKHLLVLLVVVLGAFLIMSVACDDAITEETWKSFGFSTSFDPSSVEGATLDSSTVTDNGSINVKWIDSTENSFDSVVETLKAEGFTGIAGISAEATKGDDYCIFVAVKNVESDSEAASAAESGTQDTTAVLAHLIFAKVDVTIDEVEYLANTMTLFIGEEDADDAPEYVEPHTHTEETISAVAATCTESGLTEGKKCSVCGEILVAQQTVAALGHDYQDVAGTAVAATCTTDGKEADKKCSRCDATITGAVIAGGHNLDADGHCDVCDNVYQAKIETDYYATFTDALTAATSADTITLLADVSGLSDTYISDDLTLDLNNHSVAFNTDQCFIITSGHFVITGTGDVIGSSESYGTIYIAGRKADDATYSTVTIDENVTLKNDLGWGLTVFKTGNNSEPSCYNTTVNFYGTSVARWGLTVNGNTRLSNGSPIINIKSTAVINAVGNGLYLAGESVCNIEDGATIISTGGSAIEIRAGQLNIAGGTITSTEPTFEYTPEGGGNTVIGAALAVSQHTTNLPITVTINGGTFSGVKAVYEIDTVSTDVVKSENVTITINGGTFNGRIETTNNKITDNRAA